MKVLFKKIALLFSKKKREELKIKRLVGEKIVEKLFEQQDPYKSYSELIRIEEDDINDFIKSKTQDLYVLLASLVGKSVTYYCAQPERSNDFFLKSGENYEVVNVEVPSDLNYNENNIYFILKNEDGIDVIVPMRFIRCENIPDAYDFIRDLYLKYAEESQKNTEELKDEIISQITNIKLSNGFQYISEYIPNKKKVTIFELDSVNNFDEFIKAVEKEERKRLNLGYDVFDFVFISKNLENDDYEKLQMFKVR